VAGASLMSVRAGETVRGGVAALYPSASNNVYLSGYITSARGHSFSRAVDTLVKRENWNQIEGSLARWDKNGVEMSKTAFNFDSKASITTDIPEIDSSKKPMLKLPNLGKPSVDLTPVSERLKISGKQTVGVYADVWNQTKTKAFSFFKPKSPKTKKTPIVADIDTIHPKQAIIATAATPTTLSRLKPAPKMDNGFDGFDMPHYEPGKMLRNYGMRDVPDLSENQSTPSNDLIGTASSAYTSSSNRLSQIIDRYLGGPFASDNPNRKANIVMVALAMFLLLILIVLARPKIRND